MFYRLNYCRDLLELFFATDENLEYEFKEEFDQHGDVLRVANLTFIDRPPLGNGSYGVVRLAKRQLQKKEGDHKPSLFPKPVVPSSPFKPPQASRQQAESDSDGREERHKPLSRSASEPAGSRVFSGGLLGSSPRSPAVAGHLGFRNPSPFHSDNKHSDEDDSETLVAVKIFRKSILNKMRTMERNKETRKVQVKTALMKVEREIAIMKKLNHPNLIQLYDVLDSPESDILYMVLEYMPLGEILTYQNDGTFRRKEPEVGNPLIPGVVNGYFTEKMAALFFVDIMHGLAYLHDNRIIQ